MMRETNEQRSKRQPITNRPEFLSERMLRGKRIRLISYITDEHWYWIPAESYNEPPHREVISWRILKKP
jgi:hypothetical protein